MLDCLVLTPVGPYADAEFVADTVNSFLYYMTPCNTAMLLLDDTKGQRLQQTLTPHPALHVVRSVTIGSADTAPGAPRMRQTTGGLFLKQIIALQEFSRHTPWRCLLRLDDDALIIGPAPHLDALRLFDADPDVGMLGAYLRRGDGTNKLDAMKHKGQVIIDQIRHAEATGDKDLATYLTKIATAATGNGYVLGHLCTGGALFLAARAFKAFRVNADPMHPLGRSYLDDDLLFAMHTFAGNLRIKDFSDREHVMAINWRGLPMPLEQLVTLNKKIVHPVKELGNRGHEENVRAFFRERRISHPPIGGEAHSASYSV